MIHCFINMTGIDPALSVTIHDPCTTTALQEAIDAQYATFAKHFLANDMDSLKNLYTEDCKIMPPGTDTMTGNNVVPGFFAGLITGGAKSLSLVADEVGPLGGTGDMIFERGHHKFSKADGSPVAAGKHVVIWKKTDEGYKLYIDIFNDN